jgi:hypothetical protein
VATNEELEHEVALLKTALVQITGALVATRRALNVIANQPTLMLPPDARANIYGELNESIGRVENALRIFEMMTLQEQGSTS